LYFLILSLTDTPIHSHTLTVAFVKIPTKVSMNTTSKF